MGLQEKRLANHLANNIIPQILSEIKLIAGFEPQIDIVWETYLAFDERPLLRLENDVLPGLIDVFSNICKDDLGKQALKENLKIIKFENTDIQEEIELSFSNGILYHKMQLAGDIYSRYTPDYIVNLLEQNL